MNTHFSNNLLGLAVTVTVNTFLLASVAVLFHG
jgi:hypothetical protein